MNQFLNAELARKRSALAALCRRYDVTRLDLFGSAATEDWHPGESDLDFVVTFRPDPGRSLADRYLSFAEELEALFGRHVDLLTEDSNWRSHAERSIRSAL